MPVEGEGASGPGLACGVPGLEGPGFVGFWEGW